MNTFFLGKHWTTQKQKRREKGFNAMQMKIGTMWMENEEQQQHKLIGWLWIPKSCRDLERFQMGTQIKDVLDYNKIMCI